MPGTEGFNPRAAVPKRVRPKAGEVYGRAENPRGELGFYIQSDGKSTSPLRCKARSSCFVNLSAMKRPFKGPADS